MYSFTGNEYIEKAVENYSDAMLNAAYSILKSTADAEDVVQEAFLKYIRKRPVFNSDEHEKAWLIRVTINTAKDMLKSSERKNLPICEDILYNQIDESQKTANSVLECVFNLEEKYRIVIHLYYYEEYSLKEIASILQLPLATVGTAQGESIYEIDGITTNEGRTYAVYAIYRNDGAALDILDGNPIHIIPVADGQKIHAFTSYGMSASCFVKDGVLYALYDYTDFKAFTDIDISLMAFESSSSPFSALTANDNGEIVFADDYNGFKGEFSLK